MDSTKRKALEAAGWTVGDAADFLEMNDAERRMLDARMRITRAVLGQCPDKGETAVTSNRRRAVGSARRNPAGRNPDVSLDQVLKVFLEAGGKVVVKSRAPADLKSAKDATLVLNVTVSQAPTRARAKRARKRLPVGA